MGLCSPPSMRHLEVAVQDVLVVERLHAEAHLDEERPHRRLRQLPVALCILEVTEQVAMRGKLRHDVKDVGVDEGLGCSSRGA